VAVEERPPLAGGGYGSWFAVIYGIKEAPGEDEEARVVLSQGWELGVFVLWCVCSCGVGEKGTGYQEAITPGRRQRGTR
jgi:hypothetical protein